MRMKKINHLWKKIFSQYAVLILIAFLLVFVTIYFTMSNAMQRERRVTMEQQLEICASKLDARIEEVMNLHTQFLNDRTFRSCIQAHYDSGMTLAHETNLENLLSSVKDSSWLVNSIYVLDSDMQVIGSTRTILSEDENVERVCMLTRELVQEQAFRSFYYVDGKLIFIGAIYLDSSYDYVIYVCVELSGDRMFYNFTAPMRSPTWLALTAHRIFIMYSANWLAARLRTIWRKASSKPTLLNFKEAAKHDQAAIRFSVQMSGSGCPGQGPAAKSGQAESGPPLAHPLPASRPDGLCRYLAFPDLSGAVLR